MLKMLKISGATPEAIKYIKVWECPVCKAMVKPATPQKASTRLRPYQFNKIVAMDVKYLKDADQKTHLCLHCVCTGTADQGGILVKSRESSVIVDKYMDM